MGIKEILQVGAAIIASLGGGAVIVLGLSNWLGKVWADRLMQKERHEHAVQLEHLREALRAVTEERLASLQAQLDVAKQTHLKDHLDRITIYRAAVDLLAGIVAKVVMMLVQRRGPLTSEELSEFETQRLRVYGYLAMHAPQEVMDAHDALTDLILEIVSDGKQIEWAQFRDSALRCLNEIRKDIGMRPEPIEYRGTR